MTRLTNNIRAGIVSRLIAHRFQEEFSALAAEHAAVALAAYRKVFTADEIALMDSLPDGWLPCEMGFDVRVSGRRYHLSFGGNGLSWLAFAGLEKPGHKVFRVPTNIKHSGRLSFAEDSQIGRVIDEHFVRVSGLEGRIAGARRAATTAVESVSTAAALLKVWPEVEPFLPKGSAPAKLPAIKVSELNAALGLPVEDAA